MPVDYLDLRQQAKDEARKAKAELELVAQRRLQAASMLAAESNHLDAVRAAIEAAAKADPRLRCAKPASEPLDQPHPLPSIPPAYTLIAADGSQINPNNHEPLNYFLINLGGLEFRPGPEAPQVHTRTSLHFAEYTTSGSYSEEHVRLERDKGERMLLAELARQASQRPIFALTDGPLELWGDKLTNTVESQAFSRDLNEYLRSLDDLHRVGSAVAGYVDKPRADLLVRMLEIVSGDDRGARPFRGVTDAQLLTQILAFGQRSSVFATQSQSAAQYTEHRALHFFYLNVGRTAPWLARVEIPAWVDDDPALLDGLHALLVEQSSVLGAHPYPYVLYRAHEIALVKFEEHEQVSRLLQTEMNALGVEPGELSHKQFHKSLRGKRRHTL